MNGDHRFSCQVRIVSTKLASTSLGTSPCVPVSWLKPEHADRDGYGVSTGEKFYTWWPKDTHDEGTSCRYRGRTEWRHMTRGWQSLPLLFCLWPNVTGQEGVRRNHVSNMNSVWFCLTVALNKWKNDEPIVCRNVPHSFFVVLFSAGWKASKMHMNESWMQKSNLFQPNDWKDRFDAKLGMWWHNWQLDFSWYLGRLAECMYKHFSGLMPNREHLPLTWICTGDELRPAPRGEYGVHV